jgi:hypothetical protein
MKVTINLPEDIATALKIEWKDVPQRSRVFLAASVGRRSTLTKR